MKKIAISAIFVMAISQSALAQTTYDSTTKVDTNNNSTSTSTVNSTNTNNNNNVNVNTTTVDSKSRNVNINRSTSTSTNINTGDMTNRNINTSTSTAVNTNNNTSTSTSTNTNINQSISDSTQKIDSVNKNDNYNKNDINQKIESPPPTAVAPAMMSGGNSDLCTTGISGAAQTQILGISFGGTMVDKNCERLKLSKTLYDMGMKVAAVATMCQDKRVFDAMWNAGTPCPFEGKIGEAAKQAWLDNPDKIPRLEKSGG